MAVTSYIHYKKGMQQRKQFLNFPTAQKYREQKGQCEYKKH